MKVFYYSIYDKDAKEYGPLFQAKNDMIARRVYRRSLADVPDDVKLSYSLHCMFEMDTEDGQLKFPFEEYEVSTTESEADK